MLMSEGAEWELRIVQDDGQLGENLIDEKEKLDWEKITDPEILENSLVVLIYSSGTTGLPKGNTTSSAARTKRIIETDTPRRQTLSPQPRC